MTVGGLYAGSLLNEWLLIRELSKKYRERMQAGKAEANSMDTKEVLRNYIACMTSFWGELRPKIEGRNDDRIPATFVTEFMKYEPYYFAPPNMSTEENAGDIFKLETVLREAIERLRITIYEW